MKPHIYGSKGVGSQGDGTAQFLARLVKTPVLATQLGDVQQAFDEELAVEPTHRHDRVGAEHRPGVGAFDDRAQVGRRDVVDVERQDLEREVGVAQPAPAGERAGVVRPDVLEVDDAQVGAAL